MPPLIGSVAVAGRIEPPAIVLAAVIVLWTVPHFWSLALFRHRDYRRAGIRVIPHKGVVPGIVLTLMVFWRHRANIARLKAGTEPKIGQKSA